MSGKYPRAKFSSLLTITIYTCNSRRGPNILQLDFSVRQSLSRQIVHIFREADEDSATLRFFLLPFCQKRGILAHFEQVCVLFQKPLSSILFFFRLVHKSTKTLCSFRLIRFNKPHGTAIGGGVLLSPTHTGRQPRAALHILTVNRKRPHRSPRSPASFWLFGAPL